MSTDTAGEGISDGRGRVYVMCRGRRRSDSGRMASSLRAGSDSATLAEADVAVLFETSSLFINHAVRVDTARARGSRGGPDSRCNSCCHYTREDNLFVNTSILIKFAHLHLNLLVLSLVHPTLPLYLSLTLSRHSHNPSSFIWMLEMVIPQSPWTFGPFDLTRLCEWKYI